jgi:hypothetical protein
MQYILSLIALILCWIFIEFFISLNFIFNVNSEDIYFSIKKFKWMIRLFIIILFFLIMTFMYFFQTEELKKIIVLCMGLIK